MGILKCKIWPVQNASYFILIIAAGLFSAKSNFSLDSKLIFVYAYSVLNLLSAQPYISAYVFTEPISCYQPILWIYTTVQLWVNNELISKSENQNQ